MKHISTIIILSLFLFSSCEDFLIQKNPNTITNQSFWKTEEDAVKGLMATYGGLQYSAVMGGSAASQGHVRSDLGVASIWEAGPVSLHIYSFNDATDYVKEKWEQCYIGIFRANQIIENVPNMTLIDAATKATILGEARFIRGLIYFWLRNNYNKGSVIIHTSIPKTTEEFYVEPSTKEDVFDLIVKDLKFAKTNLPTEWPENNLGRATWGAATSILGKVYLYEEMWDKAAIEFKEVIESEIYKLTPDIGDNFNIAGEFNEESIFEVVFSDAVKAGETGYNIDRPDGSEATTRARILGPGEGNGWTVVMPSLFMIDLLKNEPVDPAKVDTSVQKYSHRARAAMAFWGDQQEFYQISSDEHWYLDKRAGFVRKFQNWTLERESNETRSGINERVIRLADVYLMYAEALLNSNGSFSDALEYINKVRRRSAVIELIETEFDKETLLTHLRDVERPAELCFEGQEIRWHDMRRWGGIKKRLEKLKSIEYYHPGAGSIRKWQDGDELLEAGLEDKVSEFNQSYENYTTDDDYFPIPNVEVTSNAAFQNDKK